MLGKDGKIEVFKTDKTKIGEINKDTEKDNTCFRSKRRLAVNPS